MFSVNEGEDFINVWQVDKIKRILKVEEIMKDKSQRAIASFGCVRG